MFFGVSWWFFCLWLQLLELFFFMFAVAGTFVARKVELLEVVDVLKRLGRRRRLLMCRSPEVLVRLGRQFEVEVEGEFVVGVPS